MEPYADHGRAPTPEMEFADLVAPFPEAADPVSEHPTEAIHLPAEPIGYGQSLPPQKLRPIRCCRGRPPPAVAGIPGGFPPKEEMVFVDKKAGECFEAPAKVGGSEGEQWSGFGVGLLGDEADKVCSGLGAGEWGPNRKDVAEKCSPPSHDDNGDGDSIANIKRPINWKRKKKSRRNLELFLESFVSEVMERQEQMHKQLIEIIEKMERERIIREEALKQQEIQRIRREEEIRDQETSRTLALISLIQNLLGHGIQILKPVTGLCQEEDGGKVGMQSDSKSDPNNGRWQEAEVQALVTLRSDLESKFLLTGSKQSIWEEISVGLRDMGYSRTALMCKQKWSTINRNFKGKRCPDGPAETDEATQFASN